MPGSELETLLIMESSQKPSRRDIAIILLSEGNPRSEESSGRLSELPQTTQLMTDRTSLGV